MKKNDLIEKVMECTGASRFDTEHILNNALEFIAEAIEKEEKVYISGFGIFETKQRAAHKALNPRTGEEIMIDSYKLPVFRASASLKERVNKK